MKVRWGIHIKEDGRPHFKLNINDWDIPSPKILRIYQWIWKTTFHWGKWNEPIKLIRECVRLKIKIQILVTAKRLWVHSKSMFTQNFKFWACSPLFIPVHFYMQDAYEFLNEKFRSDKRENNFFFCKLSIKDSNVFTQIYMLIYKRKFKKMSTPFLAIFPHRVSIEIGLTPALPLFVFILTLRTSPRPPQKSFIK